MAVGTPTAAPRAGALSVPDSWPNEACSQARALEPCWALASALPAALYFSSVSALKRCSCLVLLETVFWFPLFMLIHCCCALKQKECSNVSVYCAFSTGSLRSLNSVRELFTEVLFLKVDLSPKGSIICLLVLCSLFFFLVIAFVSLTTEFWHSLMEAIVSGFFVLPRYYFFVLYLSCSEFLWPLFLNFLQNFRLKADLV